MIASQCMPEPLDYQPPRTRSSSRHLRWWVLLVLVLPALFYAWREGARWLEARHRRQQALNAQFVTAAKSGDEAEAKHLLDRGAEVNAQHGAALRLAVERQHRPVVKLLLERGAQPNLSPAGEYPPLAHAILNDDLETAERLAAKGVDVNRPISDGTCLHLALTAGHYQFIPFLIGHGAQVNARGASGSTALHEAVKNGAKEPFDLLLAAGAKVDVTDDAGCTPLSWCIWRNEIDMGRELMARGAKPTVWSAAAFGDLPQLKEFLAAKPGLLRERNTERAGRTLLSLAAMNGRREVAEYLLELGAKVTERDDLGRTPLHHAADSGGRALIELLIANGADVNAREAAGKTPIFSSAWDGDVEATRILLRHGAKASVRDEFGNSPLLNAVEKNHDLAELLMKWGARPDATVLHAAIAHADFNMIKLLVAGGADVNAVDGEGWTALRRAELRDDAAEVTRFLIAHGAVATGIQSGNSAATKGAR